LMKLTFTVGFFVLKMVHRFLLKPNCHFQK